MTVSGSTTSNTTADLCVPAPRRGNQQPAGQPLHSTATSTQPPTVDGFLEGCLRLWALELEGGSHHAVFHAEGLGVQVDGGHLHG